jgi:mRNA (guanine-N7-)-methyltransferase
MNMFIKAIPSLTCAVGKHDISLPILSCRKGGDLVKYDLRGIKYLLGVDLSVTAISDASKRYAEPRNRSMYLSADFHVYDCFVTRLIYTIPRMKRESFAAVSCQFALHYAFESEEKLRMLLQNVSDNLYHGGYFFGTTTDSNRLVKRLKLSDNLQFGNSIYHCRFEEKYSFSKFGHRYWFALTDAIDYCHEYLVHFPTLVKVAAEYQLELVMKEGFHEYYDRNIDKSDYRSIAQRMHVCDDNGDFPMEDWEAVSIYMVFVFRKLSNK